MKMKNISVIFLVVCLLICLVPSVGFLLYGPSQGGANERLAEAPVLKTPEGEWNTNYLFDLSEYFSDRFYLRQELITAHNSIAAGVFSSSAEDDVIYGDDDWLYYGPTLGDYTGTQTMSEREIHSAAINLTLMQEYAAGKGAKFLFMPAPNKNSLYADNMPDYGAVAAEHDAQRLFRLLDEKGVAYLDLFTHFKNESDVLYFAHDSHWNSRGAAYAADLINSAFGSESEYYSDAFVESRPHAGDLYEMLYPTAVDSENDPVYGGELKIDYVGGGNIRPDSITINTVGRGSENMLIYRDSFGNLLYPYLADSSAAARFSRNVSYDLTLIESLGSRRLLIELVERNLNYLISYYPMMPAPERAVNGGELSGKTVKFEKDDTARAPEGHVLVSGVIGDTMDDGTGIYILCGDRAFEAFCLADGKFAAYIPEDVQVTGAAYFGGGFNMCPAEF